MRIGIFIKQNEFHMLVPQIIENEFEFTSYGNWDL